MLALPAPSHSVAAVPARSVANRPTPPVLGPVIKGFAPPAEKNGCRVVGEWNLRPPWENQ
ncbi:membrane proteins related to metalloendopeptidases [Cutibacterium acnes JCM 18916]|nr:membrane proteins related to metalloendopeptidases [Cutibacterium acnes JCM 18916]